MVKGELAKSKLENVNDYSLVISPSRHSASPFHVLASIIPRSTTHHPTHTYIHRSTIDRQHFISTTHHPTHAQHTAHKSRIHRFTIVFESHTQINSLIQSSNSYTAHGPWQDIFFLPTKQYKLLKKILVSITIQLDQLTSSPNTTYSS